MHARFAALAVVCLFAGSLFAQAPPRVDPRNMYERVLAIVPIVGRGTFDDPRRPMYAPAPGQAQTVKAGDRPGIIEFHFQESDDHKFALVEFVAVDREALKPILTDPSVKSFVKGRDRAKRRRRVQEIQARLRHQHLDRRNAGHRSNSMTWRTHSCVPRAHSWARLAILLCCSFAAANAAYVYDYANLLNPYTAGQWTANGTYSAATGMFTSSATNGGSLIFNSTVPGPAGTYEVRTTLTLASSGGNYYSYLRATSNSLAATGNTGTYYALQVANPTFSGGGCSATANLLKSVTGTVTIMWSGAISCHSGMVVRLVMAQSHIIFLYVDNLYVVAISDSSIAAGQHRHRRLHPPPPATASPPPTSVIWTPSLPARSTRN